MNYDAYTYNMLSVMSYFSKLNFNMYPLNFDDGIIVVKYFCVIQGMHIRSEFKFKISEYNYRDRYEIYNLLRNLCDANDEIHNSIKWNTDFAKKFYTNMVDEIMMKIALE